MAERIIRLTLGSNWCCEFRNSAGVLAVFEISGAIVSFGLLCAKLASIPGVEFAGSKPPVRFHGATTLRFNGQEHEVSMSHGDHRISALDPGTGGRATEELLDALRPLVLRRTRFRR